MNDQLDPNSVAAKPDPVLDRYLAALGHFSPGPAFADRIMAQVQLPVPAWSRRLALWRRAVLRTRRGRALLGGLAAASVISVTFAGSWAFANPELAATAFGWLAARTWLPVWQYSLRLVASVISTSAYTIASFVAPTGLLIGGVAGVLALATSALGLRHLMTRPSVTRNFPA